VNDAIRRQSSEARGALHEVLHEALAPQLARRNMVLDAAQEAALARLQRLYDELIAFRNARRSLFRRWLNPPEPPRGVYFYGGVGRGKSFLMDAFFTALPFRRKTRVHFHAFMKSVHDDMRGLARVEDLYPDGLQRHTILPTIALLKERLDIIEIDGGIDYRLRALEHGVSYIVAAPGNADGELAALFERMRTRADEDAKLVVETRTLKARRRAGSVVWFDFATLCDGPRSQLDYLELARRFAVVIVSDVPRLTPDMGNAARRFTWLVDVLYDHRVKLLLSAGVPAEDLYLAGPSSQEFARTVSRLIEMRTREYMALPHQTGDVAAV
jgi:cell division protein ZapE